MTTSAPSECSISTRPVAPRTIARALPVSCKVSSARSEHRAAANILLSCCARYPQCSLLGPHFHNRARISEEVMTSLMELPGTTGTRCNNNSLLEAEAVTDICKSSHLSPCKQAAEQ